eukprot:CAMPEP_0195515702 /NCGR_PEP_ID=MMETSP0794_2-20130614/6677_1 /TAXON_ID=515487 /ORGANISM="Stephanopyxis turris, Strain CCMP 815" /LENGTH=105 /DNA_ID=CAMNT_0040644165 /DNA_START=47 /DNA_END=361 /DNA_ORIENTATION=-
MNVGNISPSPDVTFAGDVMTKLIGSRVRCILDDGRVATGTFLCLDRLKNLLLCDVVEVRKVSSFQGKNEASDGAVYEDEYAERRLSQAMVPGKHLVKVEVEKKTW